MTKHKKRFPVFYTVYFILIALFLIGIHFALDVVRGYLEDYESAQPQYEAQRVFDKYYAGGDYQALVEASGVRPSEFETPAAIAKYLAEYTAGKTITFDSITSGLDTTKKYIVKADDVKFSAFTLRLSDEKSEKGFDLYSLDAIEVYCSGLESVAIVAPKGYTVYVNEHALDDSYLTGNMEKHISCDFMPSGVEGIIYMEYRVDGLYFPPTSVQVSNRDSDGFIPVSEISENFFRADVVYSETLQTEYSEYVINAAKAFSAYMQNDGRFATAAAYIDPASTLYTNLRTSETYFVIPHSSYSFEDVSASEFYAYDENTFSCRVKFTHILKRYGSNDYRDYIDMTLFLRKIGDQFLIYDRYNH